MKLAWLVAPFALSTFACAAPAAPAADAGAAVPPGPVAAQPAPAAGTAVVAPAPAAADAPSVPTPGADAATKPIPPGRGQIDPSLIVVSYDSGAVHVTGRPHAVAGDGAVSVSITALHSAADDMAGALAGRATTETILGSLVQPLDADGGFAEVVLHGRRGDIPHGEQLVLVPQGATQPNVGPTVTLAIP